MPKPLPRELSFINKYRINHNTLEHASWRMNGFDEDVWECQFGTARRTIDFNKILDDGALLTAEKNRNLLDAIKRFLCLQTHPALTGVVVRSPVTESMRVMTALHVLDYFLLRGEQFKISQHGFELVSADDVVALIDALTTHNRQKECIYDPISQILNHLSSVEVAPEDVAKVGAADPALLAVADGEELVLSAEQTIIARAWLKLNGFYVPGTDLEVTEHRLRVARERLLDHLVGTRTLARLRFLNLELPGLDIAPARSFSRELVAVPTKNLDDDDRPSVEYVTAYVTVLTSMRVARQQGIDLLPETALAGIEQSALLLKERTKERSRFTTLPFSVANGLLSNAIAFYLEYGEELVDFYLHLAEEGEDPRAWKTPVPEKLTALGLTGWRSAADTADEFFKQLQDGRYLYNMLEVLWGAVAVIVGTLSARRISELEGLTAASIAEEHGQFFIALDLRKKNVRGHRARALRPIPTIAADALKLLAKVSDKLKTLGYPAGEQLFEMPYSAWKGSDSNYGLCLPDLSRCFDRFCDYHQTPVDELGRRYYVRAHQLRRNFAMLFFWNGSFGGIEVLRYFLGHSKPSMTYRYVTEAVSGKVLRRVKASVAKDLVRRDADAVAELSQLMCERYGLTIHDLHILPERDVVDYIEDLMVSGEAEIEPEFFPGPKGEEYRIVYKVKRREVARDAA